MENQALRRQVRDKLPRNVENEALLANTFQLPENLTHLVQEPSTAAVQPCSMPSPAVCILRPTVVGLVIASVTEAFCKYCGYSRCQMMGRTATYIPGVAANAPQVGSISCVACFV
jgi:hypothetical protein